MPDSLRRAFRIAKAFPFKCSKEDIAKFQCEFEDLVFSPGGYHERASEAILNTNPEISIAEIEKPFLDELRREIQNGNGISKRFRQVALEIVRDYIPPGRHSVEPILHRMWIRTLELRSIAGLWRGRSKVVFVKHLSVLKMNDNSTLSEFKGEGQSSGITHKIITEKIEVQRIRRCEVCRHVYWAQTLRKLTCGEICKRKLSNKRKKEKQDGGVQTEG